MTADAKFFATPSAVRDWQSIICPGCSEEDALTDLLDWSADALRLENQTHGNIKYRARAPLRCYFIVDESQLPLPAIVAVLKPHHRWTPESFHRAQASKKAHELPWSDGQPKISARVPAKVKEWVESKGPGWLGKLVMQEYQKR